MSLIDEQGSRSKARGNNYLWIEFCHFIIFLSQFPWRVFPFDILNSSNAVYPRLCAFLYLVAWLKVKSGIHKQILVKIFAYIHFHILSETKKRRRRSDFLIRIVTSTRSALSPFWVIIHVFIASKIASRNFSTRSVCLLAFCWLRVAMLCQMNPIFTRSCKFLPLIFPSRIGIQQLTSLSQ